MHHVYDLIDLATTKSFLMKKNQIKTDNFIYIF